MSYSYLFPSGKYPAAKSLYADSNGIWISCTQDHLLFYNFNGRKFEHWLYFRTKNDKRQKPTDLRNILRSGTTLFFNAANGTYASDLQLQDIVGVQSYPDRQFASSLISDGTGGCWVGYTSANIAHFDQYMRRINLYKFSYRPRPDIVEGICEGHKSDLWIALQGGGLGHIFLKTGFAQSFTTEDGLANNTVWAVMMDSRGWPWVSTSSGLSSFNPKTCKFRNFGKEDGLLIEEFHGDAWYCTTQGEMFFGGKGGIVSFFPQQIPEPAANTVPLKIVDFAVSGVNFIPEKPLYESDTVFLHPGDNNFQVTFACLDLKDAKYITYRYRLIGVHNSWLRTDQKNRKVAFYNLKPGVYGLEVEASGKNRNWVSKTAMTVFIPFRMYETLWFRIGLSLIALVIVVGLILLYIRQIRFQARQQQDELRLEALRTQMNPHFIFNSLNSINYFISKNDKLSANHYIADFSRLIRSFLTNLSADFVPLEDEMALLKDYLDLEHLRFQDRFEFSIEAEENISSHECLIFPGLIQPFVENAIWHGMVGLENRIGRLTICLIRPTPDELKCFIIDDGIGRTLAKKKRAALTRKTSRGIGIVKERLELINRNRRANFKVIIQDLYPDREETGTQVILDIPFKIRRKS
jgi:hypothetical protein